MPAEKITLGQRRQERLTAANEFLQVIAGCGLHFFRNKGSGHDAYLSMNARGRVVWLHDDYTGARINVGKEGAWDGFSHGGTLKSLVGSLGRFVLHGSTKCEHCRCTCIRKPERTGRLSPAMQARA
ncbi:hypothetical protein SAMN04488697_109217 [Pseudomonas sp. 43mfcvi1.1]|nr:hypothetical protein ATJ40_109217 [Pseudomonas sp. 43mfcvi1.1]SSB97858.1 hypothetical protein SAMN04488697_109217 [Pseudomonas sp. 43mfcvi1.1]